MSAAGQELARHLPCYNTQYDGKGGVAHEAHGGIWCRCGEWDSGPVKGIRPWEDYWEHVGQSVARVVVGAALAPIEDEWDRIRDDLPESFWKASVWIGSNWTNASIDVADRKRIGCALLAAARDAAGRSGGGG